MLHHLPLPGTISSRHITRLPSWSRAHLLEVGQALETEHPVCKVQEWEKTPFLDVHVRVSHVAAIKDNLLHTYLPTYLPNYLLP